MKRINIWIGILFFLFGSNLAQSQPDRWQQRVSYQMEIDFDVTSHRFKGRQSLTYTNNSPDTLNKVFYHLYFNAFQPGSMMDMRSRTIKDPDPRVGSRIASLKENEIGYHRILSLKQNGVPISYEVVGTVLEVSLASPILPNSQTVFDMTFESQVPVQIRRSGRDNREGIAYSMAQWYPKMCEYDYQGWHANPYVGREFYGVWGDFDVRITIDRAYTIGGTGYLQDAEKIGHGYVPEEKAAVPNSDRLTWHFKAPNVHDFMWAADPDYTHDTFERKDGLTLHFFYQKSERNEEAWRKLPEIMDRAFDLINERFGRYPYDQYSFVQGGDGGMEYPMATLITGERSLVSLVGVSVHELFHSWYQMILGTNESLYAWMDEGFTSYASDVIMDLLRKEGVIPGMPSDNPHRGSYASYINFARSGMEEPLITHADHFMTNSAYGVGSYSKGAVFLHQLEYVIGKPAFDKGLLRYFNTWKFKHPNANDFIRIMEKQSGLELDWYREYFVHTTHQIDYRIASVEASEDGQTVVNLERTGLMPMPLDVVVTYSDGSRQLFNIPLQIMRGHKPQEFADIKYSVAEDWPWTHPACQLTIPAAIRTIKKVEIDPSGRMADVDRENNAFTLE